MPLPGFPQQWFTNNLCIHRQKRLRLSWAYLEPGQINMELHKAQHPTLIPLLWQELSVFFSWHVKAASHKPQRGLRERPGQARAWGCQGREKGLGLNENKLPDCNNFIPYLLLSPIQSLSCFLSCRGSQSFSPVAVRIAAASLNSLRVFSALDGAAERKPHVTECNGRITTRLWPELCSRCLFCYFFPTNHAVPVSFHSSLGHYILEVFKTNECWKCNLSLSTKKEIMSWLLLQTKQKSRGCKKGLHFVKQQGIELAVLQWGWGVGVGNVCSQGILATQAKIVTSIIYLPKPETCLHFRHLL